MGTIGGSGRERVFVVLFDEEHPEAIRKLRERYPVNFERSSTAYLIRTQDLAEAVARNVGIKGEERVVSGVVFKLNSVYSGYTSRTLWDWLGEVE